VVRRTDASLEHRIFRDLSDLIPPGDVVVLNETRVLPARLRGRRSGGGAAELLLLRPLGACDSALWEALVRPGARLRPGRRVDIAPDLHVDIVDVAEGGLRVVRLVSRLPPPEALLKHGTVPLPPYIDRDAEPEDTERYQTVYARAEGSVAAPTAGLHFTPALLEELEGKGVRIARIVLHVGIGTFRPVDTEDPSQHTLHAEWFDVPADAVATITAARARGGRVWAVGTTVTRTLEAVVAAHGELHAVSGWTDLFIRPPYEFRVIDRLITNFHLPRSTLLMLVAAFGGYERIMQAYRAAVEHGYRFYSYGDAMAIV
jgi:S-adenosylmethionine:tRNA ribosyltransferase-isomerase